MNTENFIYYLRKTWDIAIAILSVLLPIALIGGGIILVLSLIVTPFILLGDLFDYIGDGSLSKDVQPFTQKAIDTPYYIDGGLKQIGYIGAELFNKYPYITLIVVLLVLSTIIKITLKRRHSISDNRSIPSLVIMAYLFYVLVTYSTQDFQSISSFLSIYISSLNNFINAPEHTTINIEFGRQAILILLYIIFAYWINSRLLWLFSIFLLQALLIYSYYQPSMSWFEQLPSDYYRLLQGVIPVIIAAPYALAIWIFRDNDKYTDFNQKEQEILLRTRESRIKESELELRKKELSLKEKEFDKKT